MPKTAAAILGLALAVGAIGFNTTRYPVVWQAVAADVRVTSANEAAAAPTTGSSPTAVCPPQTTQQDESSQSATAVDAETEAASKTNVAAVADAAPPSESAGPQPDQSGAPATAPDGDQASTGKIPPGEPSRKSLVPVLPPSAPNGGMETSGSAKLVCRLPPVDHRGAASAGSDTARGLTSSDPPYPTTSTPRADENEGRQFP
jgi:hypothetical protein